MKCEECIINNIIILYIYYNTRKYYNYKKIILTCMKININFEIMSTSTVRLIDFIFW